MATTSETTSTKPISTYLIFSIGSEEYGVPIQRVREIVGTLPTTPMPGSQPHLRGVMNLRGRVIPVLCIRSRFHLQQIEPHPHNVIIVLESADHSPIGVAVDRVKEVAKVTEEDFETPPSYGMTIDTKYIAAISKSQGRLRILLDIDCILTET